MTWLQIQYKKNNKPQIKLTLCETEFILLAAGPAELGTPSSNPPAIALGGFGFSLGGGLLNTSLNAFVTVSERTSFKMLKSSLSATVCPISVVVPPTTRLLKGARK